MNRHACALVSALLVSSLPLAAPALRAEEPAAAPARLEARAAFEALKGLAGEWQGHTMTEDGEPGATRFRVTAGGHAVEEVMFPGTEHEMVNMYHLVGDELVMTHYCAEGNQPQMKLDLEASTAGDLVFAFAGGTNFDPARDGHIHAARLAIEGNRMQQVWESWNEGKPVGEMKFFLKRAGS